MASLQLNDAAVNDAAGVALVPVPIMQPRT